MDDITIPVTYFAEPGPHNTDKTIELALRRTRQLHLDTLIVATDSGKTAFKVLDRCADLKVVAVTNPRGAKIPVRALHDYLDRFQRFKQDLLDEQIESLPASLSDEVARSLVKRGAVVTRVDWARIKAFKASLMALDRVGVATRVAVTVSLWAYLAEAIPPDQDVVAIAGTGFGGGGADTAIVVRTGATWKEFRVLETIARPRISPPSES